MFSFASGTASKKVCIGVWPLSPTLQPLYQPFLTTVVTIELEYESEPAALSRSIADEPRR